MEAGPKLESGDSFFLDAFHALSTERNNTMTEGPIRLTAIDWFARREGLSRAEQRRFEYIITRLDACYLDILAKEQAAEAKKAQHGSKRK